ncbi:DUF6192 family protein [Streptomyces sp. NPDC101194]|uniref:DUF6192 family protein n=1 Tax=Streptomyces sp. NPDC101194 TaxID=3366127 RepID=UPI003821A41E
MRTGQPSHRDDLRLRESCQSRLKEYADTVTGLPCGGHPCLVAGMISAIRPFALVGEVAAEVSGDLMRRPAVASTFTSEHKVRVVELGPGW